MNEETTEVDTAGFDEGFANAPAPTVAPVQEQEEAKDETPPVEYAQLTKAEYDELKSLRATQEKSFGTAFGKIGGIERTIAQLQAAPQVEISQEDIDTLRGDGFEPLALALEKVRNLKVISNGIAPEKLDEMLQQRIAPALESIDSKIAQTVEVRLLSKQHPDWKEIDQSEDFKTWIGQQPKPWIDQLLKANESYDSDFIGAAMTKFKQSRKPVAPGPAPAGRSRMSAAVTPRGSGTPTAANALDEFDAGFKTG